jgi:hypothetical protein
VPRFDKKLKKFYFQKWLKNLKIGIFGIKITIGIVPIYLTYSPGGRKRGYVTWREGGAIFSRFK